MPALPREVPERLIWLGTLLWPKLRPQQLTRGQLGVRWVFVAVGLLLALGIYAAAVWFLRLCYGIEVIGPLLCRRLLDVVLLVLLSVLLLSNVVTALGSYFLAPDLELLVPAPIPPRVLFSARLVEQAAQSTWMVVAFAVPVLLAFVRVAGTPRSYLALAAVVPPLLALPALVGLIVTLLLVRLFPAARVRGLVVGLAFVAFVVLYIVLRLLQPERLLNPDGFASLVSFLTSFSAPSGGWLPSRWAAVVIGSTFRDDAGSSGGGALLIAALWSGAASLHAISSLLHRRLYAAAFSRSQEGRAVAPLSRWWGRWRRRPLPADGPIRPPGRHGVAADWARFSAALAPRGAVRELMVKDLKLFVRDPSQWSQLVLLAALVFVYLYNFRHFRQIGASGLVSPLTLYLFGLGLSGFVTTAVGVRFAFPVISAEGRMLWLLFAAPLHRAQLLRAKLASTLPAMLFVAELMAIVSAQMLGAGAALTALGALVAALTATAAAGISLGVGALLPDYRAESAAKVAASFGALVCMTLAMLVAFALVGWAAYPAAVLAGQRVARVGWLVVCALGALLTTGVAVGLSLWLGGRALDRQAP
ncbi:MAG: hypothetical protein IPL40_01550 [Proteobacteria bacterium]|nr:hypothetical protein [Pseudomonadota bacterium]